MAGAIERGLKGVGRWWLRRTAPAATPMPSPLPTRELENISRILVVRLDDRLGNVVLLTSLLVALKGRFSRAQLSCLLARRYWDMREFLPSADEFIPFDRAALARNPLGIRGLLKHIQSRHFDLVINASDDRSLSFNHLAVTAKSRGRIRVGHAHEAARPYYEIAVPLPQEDGPTRHVNDMYLDLLRAVTPIRSTTRPLLKPPRQDTGYGERFLRERETDRPLVLIHPGGRGPKRWDPDQFAGVARALHESGEYRIGLVWGPADEDAAATIQERVRSIVQPAGILPFPDLVSLIRAATVFVACDSGPMHLASAMGTATVAIFLVSDAQKYHPLGDDDVTLDAQVQDITVNSVVMAVRQAAQNAADTAAERAAIIAAHSGNDRRVTL